MARRFVHLVDEFYDRGVKLSPIDWTAAIICIVGAVELTRRLILKYADHEELLAGDLTMQRAIVLRNPYVDPMSLMQVDLLRRWRASGREDENLFEALLASVNGIAQGMQNTG